MRKGFVLAFCLIAVAVSSAAAQKDRQLEPSNSDEQISLFNGGTTVRLSSDFRSAMTVLQINVSRIFPARQARDQVTFPITDGTLDAGTLRGEILHSGGLMLVRGATSVRLQSFIIDTTGQSGIVLTGLVSANGSVVGRIPLFDLQLPAAAVTSDVLRGRLVIPNVAVRLRPEAAGALNQVFQTNAFVAGFDVGSATVEGNVY